MYWQYTTDLASRWTERKYEKSAPLANEPEIEKEIEEIEEIDTSAKWHTTVEIRP